MGDTLIYISGKVSGTDDYVKRFAKAEKDLREIYGVSVVNPVKVGCVLPETLTYDDYMKIDMALLEMCDGIYMLNGWEESCGANREYGFAMASDMTIMFESGAEGHGYNARKENDNDIA